MLKTTAIAPWGTSAKPTLRSEVAQVIAREIGIAVSPEEKVRLGSVRRVNTERPTTTTSRAAISRAIGAAEV